MATRATSPRSGRSYRGDQLHRISFPLGGIGAGMLCLQGGGGLSQVSLRGHPALFHEPLMFAALHTRGTTPQARVLEGPVPPWKVMFPWGGRSSGNGGYERNHGMPRFTEATFEGRFPFARVALSDPATPIRATVTGWSPFTPPAADDSSLPVAALEYALHNTGPEALDAVFSFHAQNFMVTGAPGARVGTRTGGFVLSQSASAERPFDQGGFAAWVEDEEVAVNPAWFRGRWSDWLTVLWKSIRNGDTANHAPVDEPPSPGGSLAVPFTLEPGATRNVRLLLAWYVPQTDVRWGGEPLGGSGAVAASAEQFDAAMVASTHHRPWYAGAFADLEAVASHWSGRYEDLRQSSLRFADCLHDTSLPAQVLDAVAANLSILKSPTVLRQADGRLWCWEGCGDDAGCCPGSCTHVWNYAQAIAHLFPELERSLREVEFGYSQDERGHQAFRASLPAGPVAHDRFAATDGQLGGIVKCYRDWRISGDTEWLRRWWPRVRQSMDFCIETWDPDHEGVPREPQHNTYDIEFWGRNGMSTSFYLAALQAAVTMAAALDTDTDTDTTLYAELLQRGQRAMATELWNGEYFIQQIQWQDLRAGAPTEAPTLMAHYSPEAVTLMEQEGPKYQYGEGCLADGVLGQWLAEVSGLPGALDPQQVEGHLDAVYRYNFRRDLTEHANPQRTGYAHGAEAGLLLCTWPRGNELTLPFIYSDEVWTGIEYQAASHLILHGRVEAGLELVRACRDRYEGRTRNPFNEYECGHWYARALSSYALLYSLTGARYDAVDGVLYLQPRIDGDFHAMLCTATGYATVGVRDGEPFVTVVDGDVPYQRILYRPAGSSAERSIERTGGAPDAT